MWRKFSLTGSEWNTLRKSATLNSSINGYIIKPTSPQIESLSESQRSRLYNYLADNSLNFLQADAFRYPTGSSSEWLGQGLPPRIQSRLQQLMYQNGGTLFLSDLSEVFTQIPERTDRLRVLKAVSRQPSYLVRLKLNTDSDVAALSRYWSVGKRRKDVFPILESLAQVRGGERIDVSHLMPQFARARLYTYPARHEILGANHDCFWTALNFFNDPPDEQMGDVEYSTAVFKKDYSIVSGAPRLGDILVYGNNEKGAFHTAVYVAGGFVFTKNGTRVSSPWLLMILSEMKKFYAQFENTKIVIYRKKENIF